MADLAATTRRIWRLCAMMAGLVIALTVAFAMVPDINACGGNGDAWPTLQRAESAADVISRVPPDCQAQIMPALRASMWLDAIAYIPVYGAFLFLALLALRQSGRTPPFFIGVVMLVAGLAFDQWEGVSLLAIINDFPGRADQFPDLIMAYNGKVFFLGATSLVIGVQFLFRSGWMRFVGVLMTAGALASMTVRSFGHQLPYLGLVLCWTSLAITATIIAFRRTDQQG
jgi:hypothetical protein